MNDCSQPMSKTIRKKWLNSHMEFFISSLVAVPVSSMRIVHHQEGRKERGDDEASDIRSDNSRFSQGLSNVSHCPDFFVVGHCPASLSHFSSDIQFPATFPNFLGIQKLTSWYQSLPIDAISPKRAVGQKRSSCPKDLLVP
jgi:hypothetical protein